jgi:hypothetical protein
MLNTLNLILESLSDPRVRYNLQKDSPKVNKLPDLLTELDSRSIGL